MNLKLGLASWTLTGELLPPYNRHRVALVPVANKRKLSACGCLGEPCVALGYRDELTFI
jgi:hypothetical protein